ncbi:hypothetical protein HU001_04645 [Staphylococcus sp. SS21]|nr:hypothetical protein [Staphylococcus singaporensis]
METIKQEVRESIVKGIIAGYKDYVNERNEVKKRMVISDAYVYTKSNHIENQVAKHLENFVKYIKENAGPSWKYLKFIFNIDEEKNNIIFILKNEDYFDEKNVTIGKSLIADKNKKDKNYLKKLMDKNRDIDFDSVKKDFKIGHQMTADSILFNIKEGSNRDINSYFLIITYRIDKESKQLVAIKQWLPHPETNSAIMIDDLTPLLEKAIVEIEDYRIDEEELEVLKNDGELEFIDVEHTFGISIDEGNDMIESER